MRASRPMEGVEVVLRFRGGLVFKAHRFLYHSTLGSRVIKKKKVGGRGLGFRGVGLWLAYLRLIDSCITQLKDQGPSRTCNESKEEGDCSARGWGCGFWGLGLGLSCLRLIDSCITQPEAQGPSRTCNESKEGEVEVEG